MAWVVRGVPKQRVVAIDLAEAEAPPSLDTLIEPATLAASPCNSQPWKFRIGQDTVEVWADRTRSLGAADAGDRELTMACGAAIFNLRTLLACSGYAWLLDVLPMAATPDLLGRLIARAGTAPSRESLLLRSVITEVRTVWGRMRSEAVPPSRLTALATAAGEEHAWMEFIHDPRERRAASQLIERGTSERFGDESVRRELATWVRGTGGGRDRAATDGVDGKLAGLTWLAAPARRRVWPRLGGARAAARQAGEQALRAPALAVIGTRDDTPAAWIAAGQALQRVLLRAAADGVQAGFLSAPVHVLPLRAELADLVGERGYPQVVLRLGHTGPLPREPRRPLADVLA